MSNLTDKLVDEIKKNVDQAIDGAEGLDPEYDHDKEMRAAIKRSVEPLVDKAILPLAKEVGELKDTVNKINSAIPQALTAIGAGAAAAGAAGASKYSPTQAQVQAQLQSISLDLDDITKPSS